MQLNNLINSKYKKQIQLFFILSIFCFTQFNAFTHQIQHFDSIEDSQCLICISVPDILTGSSIEVVFNIHIHETAFDFNLVKSRTTPPIRIYSTRAPPYTT